MGEDTKEYENGVVSSTEGSWEAGVDGAQPGIAMQAHPEAGDPYRQEYYAGHAEDMAQVLHIGNTQSVPYGDFENLVETQEWSPLEPDVVEQKYYAVGIGLILEVGQDGAERVELLDVVSPDIMAGSTAP